MLFELQTARFDDSLKSVFTCNLSDCPRHNLKPSMTSPLTGGSTCSWHALGAAGGAFEPWVTQNKNATHLLRHFAAWSTGTQLQDLMIILVRPDSSADGPSCMSSSSSFIHLSPLPPSSSSSLKCLTHCCTAALIIRLFIIIPRKSACPCMKIDQILNIGSAYAKLLLHFFLNWHQTYHTASSGCPPQTNQPDFWIIKNWAHSASKCFPVNCTVNSYCKFLLNKSPMLMKIKDKILTS